MFAARAGSRARVYADAPHFEFLTKEIETARADEPASMRTHALPPLHRSSGCHVRVDGPCIGPARNAACTVAHTCARGRLGKARSTRPTPARSADGPALRDIADGPCILDQPFSVGVNAAGVPHVDGPASGATRGVPSCFATLLPRVRMNRCFEGPMARRSRRSRVCADGPFGRKPRKRTVALFTERAARSFPRAWMCRRTDSRCSGPGVVHHARVDGPLVVLTRAWMDREQACVASSFRGWPYPSLPRA